MHRIFRNSALCVVLSLCVAQATAMSRGALLLDIKEVDGKPAACIPTNDEEFETVVQLDFIGVSRSTGPTTPGINYWEAQVPTHAKPVYLKRGECIVYGQYIEGARVDTPPKPLDVGKTYYFAIIPRGEAPGPVYGAGFCVLKRTGGGTQIVQPTKDNDPCPHRR
ncbi:hypothetical protein [Burkholderia thailandensis]|uniref:hypothetical protein n=1 Tax=Burkholderia thailandensis TaxID=57975 RepID=UPI00016A317D|nr:hypothetical protein [Burkholderia thailandensis]AVR26647.1 hypothetical protein A8H32_17735 [Burkholderia thailandensis]MCS3393461.1 hypothetical protein [Burkholderia thailandensis]MCS6427030.1 hypothetical protein [Burkholderia thailandensis]MCS6454898.1 hypothetical protein [Burkholderia thailandensis]MCS6466000.1 hypothetical protein [Burkholderia thailandensis]